MALTCRYMFLSIPLKSFFFYIIFYLVSIDQTKVHDTSMSLPHVFVVVVVCCLNKGDIRSIISLKKEKVFDVCMFSFIFVSRLILWILKNFVLNK